MTPTPSPTAQLVLGVYGRFRRRPAAAGRLRNIVCLDAQHVLVGVYGKFRRRPARAGRFYGNFRKRPARAGRLRSGGNDRSPSDGHTCVCVGSSLGTSGSKTTYILMIYVCKTTRLHESAGRANPPKRENEEKRPRSTSFRCLRCCSDAAVQAASSPPCAPRFACASREWHERNRHCLPHPPMTHRKWSL